MKKLKILIAVIFILNTVHMNAQKLYTDTVKVFDTSDVRSDKIKQSNIFIGANYLNKTTTGTSCLPLGRSREAVKKRRKMEMAWVDRIKK